MGISTEYTRMTRQQIEQWIEKYDGDTYVAVYTQPDSPDSPCLCPVFDHDIITMIEECDEPEDYEFFCTTYNEDSEDPYLVFGR